ncbi:MAG: LysE family translocator [Pseudomonadota bacterium]
MLDAFPILIAAWGAFAAAAISPGPNMVAVAARALGSGRQSALAVATGISIGAFLWAILCAVGLGVLFDRVPVLLQILGLLGGSYLAWLGFKGWRAALTGASGEIAPKAGGTLRADFAYGFVVTATNPKVALLWASLATFVSGVTQSLPVLVLFASGAAMLAFTIYGAYAVAFSAGQTRKLYARFSRVAEAIFGTAFGGLGIALIVRSVRPA